MCSDRSATGNAVNEMHNYILLSMASTALFQLVRVFFSEMNGQPLGFLGACKDTILLLPCCFRNVDEEPLYQASCQQVNPERLFVVVDKTTSKRGEKKRKEGRTALAVESRSCHLTGNEPTTSSVFASNSSSLPAVKTSRESEKTRSKDPKKSTERRKKELIIIAFFGRKK